MLSREAPGGRALGVDARVGQLLGERSVTDGFPNALVGLGERNTVRHQVLGKVGREEGGVGRSSGHRIGVERQRSHRSLESREHRLASALEGQTTGYEYVLVDCPPSLGLLTVNALTAVDSVLIPIQCEYYALEGLSQLLGTIRIVQKSLHPGLAIEGVLLTMYDQRLNLARQVQDEAVEYFGEKVYDTVIPRNVRLSEAPSFGQPVILYDILSAGAVSYMKLAEELIERCRPRERG